MVDNEIRGPTRSGGGGRGAVGTQDHGGLREPGGISNQGEVESREQKKEDDENQENHKIKEGSVGSTEPQYYERLQKPGAPQDQGGPIGQQDHGGLGEPEGISNQGEQWDQVNKKIHGGPREPGGI